MGTTDNSNVRLWRTAIRVPHKLKQRLLAAQEKESAKVGIGLSEAAIVRRCLELGLAQLERGTK